ncbi:ABC transporter ATP-binding protein [Nocardiopsis sp. HNM0947]|uniref:ABC transporter ATP-binding protein n=1 Tax=Nocardiopsis coralli TaxID=2772213 RepID=A0ABR9PER8_9ACTN|nr:ABC transporter ATP-binding protein [Nocardiopsis coralli]MBE3002312.1 ABC transporter ATP-binding protein [Nocardiopsis coralli]
MAATDTPATGPEDRGPEPVPRARIADLWPYVHPHRRALAAALALGLLGAGAAVAQPLLVAEAVDTFADGVAPWVLAVLPALLIASAGLTCLQQLILERSSERLVFDMRRRLIAHVLRLPIGVLERRKRGDLVSRVGADTSSMRRVLSQGVVELCSSGLTVVAALVFMALIDALLLGVVVGVVAALVVTVILIGRRTQGAALQLQTSVGRMSSHMERALGGVRTIRATLSTRRETDRGTQEASGALNAGLRVAGLKAVVSSFSGVAVQVVLLAVVGLGALRVASGALTVGELSAFVMYMMLIVTPVALFAGIVTAFNEALGAFGRVKEVLSLPTEHDPAEPAGDQSLDRGAGRAFEFRGAGFVYPGSAEGEWALRGVDLAVPTGGVTAIVGPSGAGKSTLFGLMERFYDLAEGELRFFGRNVDTLPRDRVRAHLAYVEQDAPALAGTVRENLLLGRHDADDAACIEALRRSNLLFLAERPADLLDLEIGENGILLSGGERQRLAIARALLSDADVLLLDEATSNLDSNNEHSLQKAIDEAGRDRTVVVIAHRLATVRHAGNIIVVEDGRVVGQGDHPVLMRSNALYRELVERQQLDPVG